jgi:tetratricopeptide (TPR) repeat protein
MDDHTNNLLARLNALLLSLPESERLDYLAQVQIQIFEQDGSIASLEAAIQMYEAATLSLPEGNPKRDAYTVNLAIALQRRYTAIGDLSDLDRAVALLDQTMTRIPATHPDRAQYLLNLGNALHRRNQRTKALQDVNRAVTVYEEAIQLTSRDSPHMPGRLNGLAAALQSRFQQTGSRDDLDRAIDKTQQAAELIPPEHPNLFMIVNNLAAALQIRSEQTNDLESLNVSIQQNERAVSLIPPTHMYYYILSANFANALTERFQRIGSIDDLNQALQMFHKLYDSIPTSHPDRPKITTNFGRIVLLRFEWMGTDEDLESAISLQKQAVELASNTDKGSDIALTLGNLAFTYFKRYERKGKVDDINFAICKSKEALQLAEGPVRSEMFNTLSSALKRRYERSGKLADLKEAFDNASKALSLVGPGYKHYKSYVGNYASCLHYQFDRTGSIDDIDRAIDKYEEAASIPDNHPERGKVLINLANALETRYERTGALSDLDRTIALDRLAYTALPENHSDRAATLTNLALALRKRYERLDSFQDLADSIATSESLIGMTPNDDPDLPLYLCNLGIALHKRFAVTKSMDDLCESVQKIEESITLTAKDDSNLLTRLSSLANSLYLMHNETNDIRFLNRAIEASEKAVAKTPSDDVRRSLYLSVLGYSLDTRFQLNKSEKDFERALSVMTEVCSTEGASAVFRIKAAEKAANLLTDRDPTRAADLLEVAVKLFQVVSQRSLQQSDQQYHISKLFGLTSKAVSLSLQCYNDPYRALALQELGRGVLAGLRLDTRSDISELEEKYPDYAKTFCSLRDQLDRPQNFDVSATLQSHVMVDITKDHRSRAKEFDQLLGTIRNLPGFDRFLLGPSSEEVRQLAMSGPIVVFNISEIRSDAILVESTRIRFIKLNVKYADVVEKTVDFLTAIRFLYKTDYRKASRQVKAVLKWLWDVCVGPVLDSLGFTETPMENWPRVWWIGNGLLNFLPLHAAGRHDSSSNSAIDRVISSYTPTIKVAMYGRERLSKVKGLPQQSILLVGMPETPDQTKLPFVTEELKLIKHLIPSTINFVMPKIPTREIVMTEIVSHQIVHLSCHGHPELDPTKSKLLLQDWQTTPLTVADLTSLHLQKPQFAFLSACHTANTLEMGLLDESLSLTSAVSLAGFPSVVGTLWQVIDQEAASVSRDVYAWMLDGKDRFDIGRSAEGLHLAVRRLKDKTRILPGHKTLASHDPIVWAPFIHVGI